MNLDDNILDYQDDNSLKRRRGKQFGIIAMFLCIASIFIFFVSFFLIGYFGSGYWGFLPFPFVVVGFTFGVIGKKISKSIGAGNGFALSSLIMGPIIFGYGFIIMLTVVDELSKDNFYDEVNYDIYEDSNYGSGDDFNWEDY